MPVNEQRGGSPCPQRGAVLSGGRAGRSELTSGFLMLVSGEAAVGSNGGDLHTAPERGRQSGLPA